MCTTQDTELAQWSHPLDIQFRCSTASGWPKLVVEVFHTDEENRVDFGTSDTRIDSSSLVLI